MISGHDDNEKTANSNATGKGKEKFIIPSSESDDAWQEGDAISDDEEQFSDADPHEGTPMDEDDFEVVDEDPFEPVYATPSAEADGVIVEALSLDNILPPGSRRRTARK